MQNSIGSLCASVRRQKRRGNRLFFDICIVGAIAAVALSRSVSQENEIEALRFRVRELERQVIRERGHQ